MSGVPAVKSVDLSSEGLGSRLSQSRSWGGFENAGMTGHGWNSTQDPYLVVYSTFGQQLIGMVQGGQNISIFGYDPEQDHFVSRFFNHQTLDFDGANWTLTDPSGQRLIFSDLPRNEVGGLDTAVITEVRIRECLGSFSSESTRVDFQPPTRTIQTVACNRSPKRTLLPDSRSDSFEVIRL